MLSKNKFLDLKNYELLYSIGEGNFSKVYRVKNRTNIKYFAAKVSLSMVNEDTKDSKETLLLFREVNLMSLLNHPAKLKFIGYSQTDFEGDSMPTNDSLRIIIQLESQGLSPKEWDATIKLINIYGIASGMTYMHEHKVLHCDLKPENNLVDDFLHPKIADIHSN